MFLGRLSKPQTHLNFLLLSQSMVERIFLVAKVFLRKIYFGSKMLLTHVADMSDGTGLIERAEGNLIVVAGNYRVRALHRLFVRVV
jgi:hypothetical protein